MPARKKDHAKLMRQMCQALYVVYRFTHDDALRSESAELLLGHWQETYNEVSVEALCRAAGYDLSKLKRIRRGVAA